MVVKNMSQELEGIVKKIKEKYKIQNLKEPLLSQENIVYLLWRLKGFIWNESIKEVDSVRGCDLGSYLDKAFDELSSLSDSWLEEIESFNNECVQNINNKKVIEAVLDMLILRNVYYQLSKPY